MKTPWLPKKQNRNSFKCSKCKGGGKQVFYNPFKYRLETIDCLRCGGKGFI